MAVVDDDDLLTGAVQLLDQAQPDVAQPAHDHMVVHGGTAGLSWSPCAGRMTHGCSVAAQELQMDTAIGGSGPLFKRYESHG